MKTNSSTRDQIPLPCTATTLCPAERLHPSQTVGVAVVHRQFSSTTTTTASRQSHQAGFLSTSTSVQPSTSSGGSVHAWLPRPGAPMGANCSSTPYLTTADCQSSPAAMTALSHNQAKSRPPLSHTQLLPASAHGSSEPLVVPPHIVLLDQTRPDDQNVFHVHTADLQICLQIISDEQLALIEPHIERHSVSALSRRGGVEATLPEVIQNKPLTFDLELSESLPALGMERIKPAVKAELTEQEHVPQAAPSAECTHPEALGSSHRPHEGYTVTATRSSTGHVTSAAASLSEVKSGRGQSSEEEPSLSLSCCAEDHRRLGRGGPTSQTTPERLGQARLSILNNQAGNAGTLKDVEDASAYESRKLESGRIHPGQAPAAACADQLSRSLSSSSINKSEHPRQVKPQASFSCSYPVHTASSQTSELSQDVGRALHSEKPLAQIVPVSSSIPVDRPEDVPDVLRRSQSPAAGLIEEAKGPGESTQQGPAESTQQGPTEGTQQGPAEGTLQGPAESTQQGPAESTQQGPGESTQQGPGESTQQGPGESTQQGPAENTQQGPGESTQQGPARRQSGGTQRDQPKSHCTLTRSPDSTRSEADDIEVKGNAFEHSRHSEPRSPQTHSGVSEDPPQIKSDTRPPSLSTCPQALLETNSLYFPGSTLDQRTQSVCESDPEQDPSTGRQHAQSAVQPGPQRAAPCSQQDQKQSGQHPASTKCPSGLHQVCCSKALLGHEAWLPSEPAPHLRPEEDQDPAVEAANELRAQSSLCGGSALECAHGNQPAECVPVDGARPVQSGQEHTEDTSSSEDEGKLIIEL
ncbi:hypothetical protein CesoFtcFv8_001745 [Champsocephalus esox]|uniref:Uncharacterized protein n=1 Tax=Champsocephalus esox TaxID=159716 RepID=A0AAN8HD98_9TELE|nr:hypothetical protein CesoFtcFv8_001745 [Champsocephalus esox]